MKFYGLLLEDLRFKEGQSPDTFIQYYTEHVDEISGQSDSGVDAFGNNPYFAIVPVFVRCICDFNTLSDVDEFLIKTIIPFVNMNEEDIKKNIDFFTIVTENE